MAGLPDGPRYPRVVPFGDAAVLVELADTPDLEVNRRVHALATALQAAPPPGLRSLVPAYVSLLVELDPLTADPARAAALLQRRLEEAVPAASRQPRLRAVPVVFGGEYGPDLEGVAQLTGLSPSDVVDRFLGVEQTVYMLGFSPGFPYLGDLPPELATPRLESPRERVPVGSVAIAGRQTGIYSSPTPGGWRLLGRSPIALFDPRRHPPAYFAPGDRVRFRPIGALDWDRYAGPPEDW